MNKQYKIFHSNNTRETNSVSDILSECESIFHDIVKMKGEKVKIAVDESITPVAQKKSRRVPLHLHDIDNELKHIFDA